MEDDYPQLDWKQLEGGEKMGYKTSAQPVDNTAYCERCNLIHVRRDNSHKCRKGGKS